MAYHKKTLRNMSTNSRKLARLINDLDSALTKLKNFMTTVERMELESNALYGRLSTYEKKVFDQEQQQRDQTKVADDLFPQQAEHIQQIRLAKPEFLPEPVKPICSTCVKVCKDGTNAEYPDSCTQYEAAGA